MQRLGVLAAAVFLLALIGSMAIVFYAVRHPNGSPASPHPTPTVSPARVPLKVTSVRANLTEAEVLLLVPNITFGDEYEASVVVLLDAQANLGVVIGRGIRILLASE